MSYSIKFLNDKDFERLPAKNIESKIGVAYPETGEAFVRSSGVDVVDVFTALHELEHLRGNDLDEHFDTENRCYYKDFGQMLSPIMGGIGSMFGGPAGGGIGGLLGSLFGGGSKPQQKQPSYNFNMPAMEQGSAAPATVQTGASGGTSAGGIGGTAIKNLSQNPQFKDIQNQQYGQTSGRSPLMSAFGGV